MYRHGSVQKLAPPPHASPKNTGTVHTLFVTGLPEAYPGSLLRPK